MATKRSKQAPLFSAFISHAKADAKKAEAIAEGLEARGFKCWIAPRDVRAGRSYGDEIIRGIESAKAFILVLSKASNASAFVAREVERAISKDKPVLAFRVANVQPGPALELFVASTQWIDAFPGRLAPHIGRLAERLAEEEGVEAASGGDDGAAKPGQRWLWPAGAAVSVLLALGAGFLLWPSTKQVSTSDPSLLTKPVWVDGREVKEKEQIARVETEDFEDQTVEGTLERPAGAGTGEQVASAHTGVQNVPPPPLTDREDFALQAWRVVKDDTNPDILEAYISRFGDSIFAPLAKARLEQLRSSPQDPDFQSCDKGADAAAIAACDRAIYSGKFSGTHLANLYNHRGQLHVMRGDLDRGQADFDRAIQLDPGNYRPYWNRAEISQHKGDTARAVADYKQALSLGPKEDDRLKIEKSLSALAERARSDDPTIITDPSRFWRDQDSSAAASVPAYPTDSMPTFSASPPMAVTPPTVLPASPAPMPVR